MENNVIQEKKSKKAPDLKEGKRKTSKVLEILTKEYKYENLFLLIVALVALVFGVMIVDGSLEVNDNIPLISDHPIVFAWVLVGISVIGLILVMLPFYQPSMGEFKKITWAKWNNFSVDLARVFIFIIFVAFMFTFYDSLLKRLFDLIYG